MNIGIIGLGDMGRLYAKAFSKAGYAVCGCDLPANREQLEKELTPFNIQILDDGKEVSRVSDLIIYSVVIFALLFLVHFSKGKNCGIQIGFCLYI